MSMDMSQADACRFCGKRDTHMQFTALEQYQVVCNQCQARGPAFTERADALTAWGRHEDHAPPPPQPRKRSASA